MKYDDLEKTKDLFDITDVPSPINNIESEGISKNHVTDELDLGLTETKKMPVPKEEEQLPEEPNKGKKTPKEKKKRWSKLSKKQKILIIVGIVLVLLIILALVLFLILRKPEDKEETKKPEEPSVIIEKENYIYKNGELVLLDKDDNELGVYKCENKDEKLCYVVSYSTEDEFDGPKNVYENQDIIETRSTIYLDKYVFIYDNSKENDGVITLYNLEDEKNEGVYTLVKGSADTNLVILKNNEDKYGIIEFSENGIIEKLDFTFDYLGTLNKNSKIVAKNKDKYYIYSRNGNLESKAIAYEIKSYTDNYIAVLNDGYYIYDYTGKLLIDEAFDFAYLLDKYVALVKDNKLYIRDYKNNKYNEDGIEIDSDDYNITNVYNLDKTLVETKKAFEITVEKDTIDITYINKDRERNKSLNIHEGSLSASLKYLNYFGGVLYFYSDEEELNLLGKYNCSNKNDVTKDTSALSNCIIATESFYSKNEVEVDNSANLGWVPIFNERYVFLLDTIDLNNPTIVLYDLKNSKILSKYASVDTGSYTKENNVTLKSVTENYVMAKNKSNKYGLIKIGDDVTSAIPFNYSGIEKLKDYYLVKENAGTYMLLSINGGKDSGKYGYKIVDYKGEYLKVVNDGKYYVYDFEGNKVEETGYLYISLADDYYVVINSDKKLDIHKYEDPSFKLSRTLDVGTEDYAKAFEVSKNDTGFVIKLKFTNETINTDSKGVIAGDVVLPETGGTSNEDDQEVSENTN